MEHAIDFYFDFMSPYAYLAHKRVNEIARKYSYELRYHCIDLMRAKLAAGNTGPSNRDIPVKIAYLSKDLSRWANRYGLPLHMPGSHDSAQVNRGLFIAIDRGVATRYVDAVWQLTWGAGGDFSDIEVISKVAQNLGWEPKAFIESIASPIICERYEQSNLDAQSKGVFGVPTMMAGNEMWWGNDRLDFLEEYLASLQ
jgi:2-hydroxychromene-2-carboxylate isomerase